MNAPADMKFCQSCAMPLSDDVLGTEKDGSKSQEYCQYCYKDGAFVADCTMEQMIEICVPFTVEAHPEMSAEQVRADMQQYFPQLKRWKQA
ncbi:zinc ribbon domain-containing protein [Ruminococcaceae bacterium OttesenSCG-928-L11]|nr:zinc ribbon domain-containing protein [Ruminococcaceae bacterium OttesenSCG-928-L11]